MYALILYYMEQKISVKPVFTVHMRKQHLKILFYFYVYETHNHVSTFCILLDSGIRNHNKCFTKNT